MKVRIQGKFHPLSDFELEAYLCEESGPAERERVELAIAKNPELGAYIAERRAARAEFAARYPLPARSSQRQAPWKLWLAGSALAAAAAVLLLPTTRSHPPAATPDTVRAKGNSLNAELYVKRGSDVWQHRPEVSLQPGDALRLQVVSTHAGYLTLLGRDSSGLVSVHYDRLVTSGGRYTAPDSLILDAEGGDEQWLLVFDRDAQPAGAFTEAFARGQLPDSPHALFQLRKAQP